MIAKALRLLDSRGVQLHVTLIGDGQDAAECQSVLGELHGNVEIDWRPWVDASLLPEVVAAHSVCLGIFGTSPKAQRVVPNKAYQGMAARCALITSDTPVQRATLPGAIFVSPGDPAALADAIEELLTDSNRLADAQEASAQCADRTFRPYSVVKNLERIL